MPVGAPVTLAMHQLQKLDPSLLEKRGGGRASSLRVCGGQRVACARSWRWLCPLRVHRPRRPRPNHRFYPSQAKPWFPQSTMLKLIAMIGIGATLVVMVGHLAVFGQKKTNNKARRCVRRFGVLEILSHALTVLSFLTLGGRGGALHGGLWRPLGGNLWLLDVTLGPVFLPWGFQSSSCPGRVTARSNPATGSGRQFGGYLWGDQHTPAARFPTLARKAISGQSASDAVDGPAAGDAGAGSDRPRVDPVGAPGLAGWRLCWPAWRTCTWARSPTPAP